MICFLTIQEILNIHEVLIEKFGGSLGVRNKDLLESALTQPQTSFAGHYLHKNIFMMAAAYTFHIIKNHPFVDGNKRTGMAAAITFLHLNGYTVNFSQENFCQLAINIATSKLSKKKLAEIFEKAVTI
ncbi:MAG: Death-on-curing family protein [candidate division TM6 bacterium GW2011_GWF2_38_10]|nr:MAG: Death-on-curing family protein [candidate division TM6 bacterium GW2011_GWF2_38_10]